MSQTHVYVYTLYYIQISVYIYANVDEYMSNMYMCKIFMLIQTWPAVEFIRILRSLSFARFFLAHEAVSTGQLHRQPAVDAPRAAKRR